MRVLSVTHGPNVPGGVFDETVEAGGHSLERWEVPLGGLPQPPTAYDAVMVFGGSMHPDQDDHFHWLASEAEFLGETLRRGVPALGVCLGAQMLARAAGAWVGPAPEPEIGWFEVSLTPEGRADPVLGALPETTHAFQWHHYTFAVPEGGTELARSSLCTQAFRLGPSTARSESPRGDSDPAQKPRAWALQFHAEVTLPMLRTWVEEEPVELPVPPEDFLAEGEARIADWNEHGRRLCAAFLEQAANGR